ncbi:MAG: Rpn family recombination-promoting nuclease/putative transposase [Opitutales bacterium]|nr:Rpn family recombination-promoting nuclease/putative transposase [Opitutales bacterium]
MDEASLHNPHDHFVKFGFGEPRRMAALLRAYLPGNLTQALQWDSLTRVQSSFLDEHLKERRSDLVFSVRSGGSLGYIYILFEHQREADRRMPFRLLRYMVRLWETHQRQHPGDALPFALPIVFYHNNRPWPHSDRFADLLDLPQGGAADWQAFVPDFRHQVFNLSQMDARAVGEDLSAGVMLKILRAILLPDGGESLRKGFEALAEIARVPGHREFIRICLTYLTDAGNDVDPEAFIEHISRIENPTLQKEAMTIAERLIEKGRTEAMTIAESLIEKGKSEGITKGRLIGERLLLERLLTRRFGPLSDSCHTRLQEATAADLERWGEAIFDATSPEDLFRS